MLKRRSFLQLAGCLSVSSALSGLASAQAYPARPVRWIIGFAPGGAADMAVRIVAEGLSERLGQPVVVDNRPGAGTNIATEAVVRAPADGYTIGIVTPANAVNATLYDKLPFNFLRDIAPVAGINSSPIIILVNPSSPIQSVGELIAYAKANPGKLNLATGTNGTANQMTQGLFKMMAGVDIVDVPYRGEALALPDLLAGQVQGMFITLTSGLEFVRDGRLRALAVTTATQIANVARMFRRSPKLCPALSRAPGMAWVRLATRRPRSLGASIARSTRCSPTQRSKGVSKTSAPRRWSSRRPNSASTSKRKPRSGARS